MIKFIKNASLAALLASSMAVGFAGIAHADECSDAIAAVTQAKDEADISDDDKAAIDAAIASATEQQTAGDAEACMASLSDSMALLGIE